jgi:hypothetical protein
MPDDVPVADVLDELIDVLAAAPCGTREIDVRIDYGLGVMLSGRADLAGTLIREGISWQTVSEVIDSRVPAYSTSLDAAVEGENVIFAIRSDKRGKWGALHRARCGREVLVWAATEPLARRLAALEGRRVDAAFERSQRIDDPMPRPRTADAVLGTGTGGHGDWKILF